MKLFNDEMGLLAALMGTLFVRWGEPLADPIAAMVVATIIAVNAVSLFRENLSFLMGRSPGPEYLSRIESIARSVPGVIGVHDMRAEYIGPETVHADMHIEVRRGLPIEEAEVIAEEVTARVHEGANGGFCMVHVDPARNGHANPT